MHLRALFFALAVVGSTFAQSPPVAELSLKDPSGQPRNLADLRGKLVVLNFWATWCLPCKAEMPLFVKLNKDYAAKNLAIVTVTLDDEKTMRHLPSFIKKQKMKELRIWVGGNAEHMAKLGTQGALPTTIFIDRDGTILSRVEGQISENELMERVTWMTGDRSSPAPAAYVNNLDRPAK